MRRWMLAAFLVGSALAAGSFLTRPICPYDYSGLWYRTEEQRTYVFQDGLISVDGCVNLEDDVGSIHGAYCPANQKLLLFVLGVDGLEKEQELYLVKQNGVETLCDRKDGTGTVYFYR